MGWNAGYAIVESMVIAAYDKGKLDTELLSIMLEPFRGSDIDSGGSQDLETKDGKDFQEVVIDTWGVARSARPSGDYESNPDEWDDYYDELSDKFRSITKQFGWG